MEHFEEEVTTRSFKSRSPPADDDDAIDENGDWNDAPTYFSTPRHHKRRGNNSAKHLHSPSQHRRRVLRRHSSGGSNGHAAD